MKYILFVFLVCSANLNAQSTSLDVDIQSKVEETLLSTRAYNSDLSWITDENRHLVFEELFRRRDKSDDDRSVTAALARVGHEDTLKMLAEELKDPSRFRPDIMYAPENAIPYLMPLVYTGSLEDPNLKNPGCIVANPVRQTAMSTVMGNIRRSNKFPVATREWAERMRYSTSYLVGMTRNYQTDEYRDLITSWWEHNQTAIVEKRYEDATWLPRYNGRLAVLDEEDRALRKMDEQRSRFPWFATGATFAETAKANPWHWVGLGVLVIAVVAGLCRSLSGKKQAA